MSKLYNCKPSDIVGVQDTYTAFCFDEACAYIRQKLEAGEIPQYEENELFQKKQEYHSFSDFYSKLLK